MKPLLCALGLLALSAPLRAQTDVAAPNVTAPSSAVKLAGGILVTPVLRPASDLESILDVHFWRFHIVAPKGDVALKPRTELRVPGRESQIVLEGADLTGLEGADFLVGLAPSGNAELGTTPKWKVSYRVSKLSSDAKPFDFAVMDERDNPLKGLKIGATTYGKRDYAVPKPNGDVPLITYRAPLQNLLNFKVEDLEKQPVIAELVLVLNAKPSAK